MPILRTATGKEYPCDFMGVANGFALYVNIKIDSYMELLEVFQDPSETEVLTWVGTSGEAVRIETGFTVFTGFDIIGGQCPVRIRMEKNLD